MIANDDYNQDCFSLLSFDKLSFLAITSLFYIKVEGFFCIHLKRLVESR